MTTALRLGGADGAALVLPIVPNSGQQAPAFAQPEPVVAAPGVTTPGDYAWPGTWNLERDVGSQHSAVTWHGTSSYQFPWGTLDHSEQIGC